MVNQLEHCDVEGVSIVIVTYNGLARLKPSLAHIANQVDTNMPCELLVVDNNSSDGSATFILESWRDLGAQMPLRIVVEDKSGTMYARQKGIVNASFRYLLFCDDDNLLNPEYLKNAYNKIKDNNAIAAIGGEGIIDYNDQQAPHWMTPAYERNYGCGPQGDYDGDITYHKGCLYTAGAIMDRQWLSKLYEKGFKSVLKGRDGKSLVAGEDTELTMALKLIGAELHFNSAMRFKHLMTPKRMTWSYLKRLHEGFGYSNYILSPYRNYFHNKKPSRKQQLIATVKEMSVLAYNLFRHGTKEGDAKVLQLQELKGKLRAIILGYNQYKDTQEVVKKISHNTDLN